MPLATAVYRIDAVGDTTDKTSVKDHVIYEIHHLEYTKIVFALVFKFG